MNKIAAYNLVLETHPLWSKQASRPGDDVFLTDDMLVDPLPTAPPPPPPSIRDYTRVIKERAGRVVPELKRIGRALDNEDMQEGLGREVLRPLQRTLIHLNNVADDHHRHTVTHGGNQRLHRTLIKATQVPLDFLNTMNKRNVGRAAMAAIPLATLGTGMVAGGVIGRTTAPKEKGNA